MSLQIEKDAEWNPYAYYEAQIEALTRQVDDKDKEIAELRKAAARWKYIEDHWTVVDIENNKDGSFKNMKIKFDSAKPTNEIGAENLRKGFDSVIAAMPEDQSKETTDYWSRG